MIQELERPWLEVELLHVYGVGEEWVLQRDDRLVVVVISTCGDFEGTEEREWPGVGFNEFSNVLPVAASFEFKARDLLDVRRNHCYGIDRNVLRDGYVERGSLHAFEESFRVDLALFKRYPGPQGAMLNEGSAPMAAHESCTESITLGREMDGDEGKDIQRNAVDGGESVPPFADGFQCSCSVLVELRNCIQCEATEGVSASPLINLFPTHDGE